MDDETKVLVGLNQDEYMYPLADVSHLTKEGKRNLLRRGMRIPKELHSDEEFEQWVTLYAELNKYSYSGGHKPTKEERERDKLHTASYERGMWYHYKRFNEWKKKHLQPLVDELADHAAHDPQYDWQFVYALEYAKLRCMRAYFSYSIIADKNGNFGFNRWIDICVNLLKYIKEDGVNISEEQIERMNIRNVDDIVPPQKIAEYKSAPIFDNEYPTFDDKRYIGREIYVRKMERLYYKIRLYKMRQWWE